MKLIMVHRAKANRFSEIDDIVAVHVSLINEVSLREVAELHPENIYYFAEVAMADV